MNTTQMRLSTTLINQWRFGTPGRVSLIHGIAFLQPRDLLKVCLTNSSGNVVDSICWHVTHFSPNLCVGFLFLVGHSRPCPVRPSLSFSHTKLSHTQLPHTQLSHTQLTQHATPPHTSLTHNSLTHNLLTHNSLTHNSLTHNSLTHSPITHSPITHNLLTHNSPTHKLCVAGVPLMALGWLWWRAWFPFLAAAVCLAGVALGSIHILCGKRGTWRHRPSLCGRRGNFGTGLALVARLVPVVAAAVCRIWTHRPPFSVVGAALGDIGIHFVWQVW